MPTVVVMVGRPLSRSVAAAVGVLLVAGCGATASLTTPGNEETDRVAQVVSDAIAWPRQPSAMAYARAATRTTAGQDGRLTVVEVTDLEADSLSEAFGELTFLVHVQGSRSGFVETDPVTACYRAELGFYGLVGAPGRVHCPDDAAAVEIPPLPPDPPRREIPADAGRALDAALRRLAAAPQAAVLETRLVETLTPDGRATRPPSVDVVVDGTDVAVSVRGDDECLLGVRTGGHVEVWQPSAVQLQPGELTCDPGTALAGSGREAPH